jgi:hypothetical protein
MPRPTLDEIADSIRERAPEVRERVRDAARDIADRGRITGLEIRRRARRAERLGRENAFVMALAALGIGILVGWALTRDKD